VQFGRHASQGFSPHFFSNFFQVTKRSAEQSESESEDEQVEDKKKKSPKPRKAKKKARTHDDSDSSGDEADGKTAEDDKKTVRVLH